MIHLQQTMEEVFHNTSKLQENIFMTARPRMTMLIWEIWFFGGMPKMKKRAKMVSLKTYGRGPTEFMPSEERMLACWKKWMEEIIQEGRPMVGFSSITMSKNS